MNTLAYKTYIRETDASRLPLALVWVLNEQTNKMESRWIPNN
jgi:hypothetical protein